TLAITGSLTNTSTGTLNLENASLLTVTGDVDNSGTLGASLNGGGTGHNTITVGGMLTNEMGATFQLGGPKDMATIGSLTNAGFADLENGSTLTVNGTADNSWELFTSSNGGSGHNTVNITGTLTNEGTGEFILYGPGD